MTAEALPMVESLGLEPEPLFESPALCLSWSGKQNSIQIYLIQNGELLVNIGTMMNQHQLGANYVFQIQPDSPMTSLQEVHVHSGLADCK